jgi:hypothetical protein
MRKTALILIIILFLLPSCRKDNVAKTSGIATIDNKLVFDNTLQTYIGYGFLFSKAKLVSNQNYPKPDITIYSDGSSLSFQTEINNSFCKIGDFADAATTSAVFDNLTSPTVSTWAGMATPVNSNQIWIYKSGDDHYAKIRVISIISEVRDSRVYAECTFEWVYQPDGTLTFPGK